MGRYLEITDLLDRERDAAIAKIQEGAAIVTVASDLGVSQKSLSAIVRAKLGNNWMRERMAAVLVDNTDLAGSELSKRLADPEQLKEIKTKDLAIIYGILDDHLKKTHIAETRVNQHVKVDLNKFVDQLRPVEHIIEVAETKTIKPNEKTT